MNFTNIDCVKEVGTKEFSKLLVQIYGSMQEQLRLLELGSDTGKWEGRLYNLLRPQIDIIANKIYHEFKK